MSEPKLTEPAADPQQSVHEAAETPDLEPLTTAGIRAVEIDAGSIDSKQDLMAAISEALELPDYFGGNWDALDEVLRDLGWLEADGHVLVLTGAEGLRSRSPQLAEGLVKSWTWAAEKWGADGVPFHLVLVR